MKSVSPVNGVANEAVAVMRHPQFRESQIVECVATKIQYADPCPSDAELARVYAEDYNLAFGRDFRAGLPEFVQRRANAQFEFIDENFRGKEPETVVEVGGGWGALSKTLLERWKLPKVVCYELDAEAAAFMRKRGVDTKIGTLETDTTMPEASLDLVMSSMMLEHVPRPLAALKKWRQKLKRGGALFVEIPLENPCPNWWGTDPRKPYWVGHLTFFGRGHLEQMLEHAGFDIQIATPHDHPVSPGYVMPGEPPYDLKQVPPEHDTQVSTLPNPKLLRLLALNSDRDSSS